ncbi:MAG: ClpXP protease specificity-enhancing factor [Alcanivorax sp.]|nr:ClpXP protease specificity-enhancing factor [Alcanivorax sp.]
MTPNRPYLIRAVYEWICDNGLTTHLLVDANYPGVNVPREFVNDGQIILNITPSAVQHIDAGNEAITFSARFGGRAMNIIVPVEAVLAVFARENGEGMAFEPALQPPEPTPPDSPPPGSPPNSPEGSNEPGSRPTLKVVK